MRGVITTVTTTRIFATCQHCSRGWSTTNALAVAARHAAAHRHTVTAMRTTAHTYAPSQETR